MSSPVSKASKEEPSTGREGGGRQTKQSKKPTGKVFIRKELCKGCGFCVNFCPRHTLVMSSRMNEKGYNYPEIDKDNCTGCDLCGMLCPDFAVYGIKIKTKTKNDTT